MKNKPIDSLNRGIADVSDILETIPKRLPPYLRGNVIPYTQEEFNKLPRDPEGNIITSCTGAFFNRCTPEQLTSISQHDKDDIRRDLWINIKQVNPENKYV